MAGLAVVLDTNVLLRPRLPRQRARHLAGGL